MVERSLSFTFVLTVNAGRSKGDIFILINDEFECLNLLLYQVHYSWPFRMTTMKIIPENMPDEIIPGISKNMPILVMKGS